MMTIKECSANASDAGLSAKAKGALERVCSGAGLDPASRYYSPSFRDHVNDLEFFGLDGVQRSVNMYKGVLSDIAITVEAQWVHGDHVTSRYVARRGARRPWGCTGSGAILATRSARSWQASPRTRSGWSRRCGSSPRSPSSRGW
jgi:hypothetical protein